MGIYTNRTFDSYGYTSSDYRDVEPYQGDHFNYHELGIIAATESAANQNAFMKAIALNELASVEQYGTDQVFYESVNLRGIFERIKAFFKKIIEKIHKILHTFIAKMSSWFQNSKEFAKKYEKEIIKNWGLVKNDWEIKGWKFSKIILTKEISDSYQQEIKTNKDKEDPIRAALKASTNSSTFASVLSNYATSYEEDTTTTTNTTAKIKDDKPFESVGLNIKFSYYMDKDDNSIVVAKMTSAKNSKTIDLGSGDITFTPGDYYDISDVTAITRYTGNTSNLVPATTTTATTTTVKNKINTFTKLIGSKLSSGIDSAVISKFREDFNEKGKDQIRYQIIESFKNNKLVIPLINCDFNDSGSLDSKEFTEELNKAIYGEDGDKEDINKSDIEKMYGGSITSMLTFLKDYDKIKDNIEKAERNLIKTIDERIKAVDTAQNTVIKDKTAGNQKSNDSIVQLSAIFQSFWGFIKECETQVFSTYLQGLKDACSQAKQIAVAVIGLNKKMTESYDYSNSYYSDNSFNSFIENVKLV